MPTPHTDETHDDFIDRCIPIVIDDGTAENGEQGRAVCESLWKQKDRRTDMDAPSETTHTVPFELLETRDEGDGLTFEGYAAVFDSPTIIDSWEGKFVEQIARGAFKKTLSERTPVLMFNHGQHPLIGDMPLGIITRAKEDDRGVFIRARLAHNWLIEPVRDAIANGSIDGMSFRMRGIKDTWDRNSTLPERTLTEVSVPELGPVVFPAYDQTSAAVRSGLAHMISDEQLRAALSDVLGTPSSEAGQTTSDGAAVVPASPSDDTTQTLTRLRHKALALQWRRDGLRP